MKDDTNSAGALRTQADLQPKQEPTGDSALLPCPFCGGPAYAERDVYQHHTETKVACNDCGAAFFHHNETQAIEAWNRRDPLVSRVGSLIASAPSVAAAAGEMMRALEDDNAAFGNLIEFLNKHRNRLPPFTMSSIEIRREKIDAALTAARRVGIRTNGEDR